MQAGTNWSRCLTSEILENDMSEEVNLILKPTMQSDVVRRYHLLRIRPVLEYNIAVWGPARVDQMNALEDVQKKVLYLITSYRRLSYDDKLQCLMLQSMRERREQCHLVQIYMIVNLYSPIQNMWQFSQGKFSLRNIHEIERTVR
eukprot:GHVN01086368.1.p1 GENE.GHVN01086368.1~~GHVN01086368.1.p1  ORF type:complete len:145 (-),score=10.57 GHVN01086368.1:226-660(-)